MKQDVDVQWQMLLLCGRLHHVIVGENSIQGHSVSIAAFVILFYEFGLFDIRHVISNFKFENYSYYCMMCRTYILNLFA